MATRLIDIVRGFDRRMVIPLMGFPGMQLNDTSLRRNVFNWGTHFQTVLALHNYFHPDGLFFLMDLSVEAAALGLAVRFPLNESPSVEEHPVQNVADLARYENVDILTDARVAAFVETMRLMGRDLNTLKGGYVIGPFSLAALMMVATEAAMATVTNPGLLHAVLRFCSGVIARYARALEVAGADMIAFLEPTASFLSPKQFREFSGQYLTDAFVTLSKVPILHVCGRTNKLIEAMAETGAQGLSLDSCVDFTEAIRRVPADVVLVGNLDTVTVMNQMTPSQVYRTTRELMDALAPYPNYIVSTACDLPVGTPLENIHALVDAVKGGGR